jgi:hypothetical protein
MRLSPPYRQPLPCHWRSRIRCSVYHRRLPLERMSPDPPAYIPDSIPRPRFHLKRRPAPGPALSAAQPPFEVDQAGVARPAPRQRRRDDFSTMPAYPAPHPDHMPDSQVFEPEGITGRQTVVHVRGLFLSALSLDRQEPPAPGLRRGRLCPTVLTRRSSSSPASRSRQWPRLLTGGEPGVHFC